MPYENAGYGNVSMGRYMDRAVRLGLIGDIADQYHARRASGEKPSIEEYVENYSYLQPELKQYLEDVEWMSGILEPLICQNYLPTGLLGSAKKKLDTRIEQYNRRQNST